MSLKFVFLIFAITVAAAIQIREPLLLKSQQVEIEEGPVEYEFSYSVHDEHTGDIKAQKEIRKGDKVEGSYELIDSDGYRRLVQYRSDGHNGFEAIVNREPTSIKIPIPETKQKLVATKILTSPLVHYAQAPISNFIRLEPRSIGLGRSEVGYDNHVSYSGSGVSYSY